MRVRLSEGWRRGVKAFLAGWLGEIFCLASVLEREPPTGEVWALRASRDKVPREAGYGHLLSLLEGSEGVGLWGRLLVRTLAEVMAPPLIRGLPRELRDRLDRLRVAWVPAYGEEWLAAEALRPWLEQWERWLLPKLRGPEELREAVVKARGYAGAVASLKVVTPASDFAAFGLAHLAVRGGDFAILRFEVLRTPAPPEVAARPLRAEAGWVIDVEPWYATTEVEKALLQILGASREEVRPGIGGVRVDRPLSEEELAPLLEEACRRARLALAERAPREGRLRGVEVIEIKTGTGRASEAQVRSLEALRREAEAARKALGRDLEVTYRVLRVRLPGFDVPGVAEVEEEAVEGL